MQHDPVLYTDSPQDLQRAAYWLSTSEDSFVIRITGGCLKLGDAAAQKILEVLVQALTPFKKGILMSGASYSESATDPSQHRPCVPEAGLRLQEQGRSGKFIGNFPARNLEHTEEGSWSITKDRHDGKDWDVKLDRRLDRGVAAQQHTPYLWDAEWQSVLGLIGSLKQIGFLRGGLVIGFDGGPATRNEYRAWAEESLKDPSLHVVLITGSDPARATDSLAADTGWLSRHPNVHCVPAKVEDIQSLLDRLGAFCPQGPEQLAFPA